MTSVTSIPQPVPPFWFKQRQGKLDPAGEGIYKLTAPNMDEAYVTIRQAANGLWSGHLLKTPEGPEIEATAPIYDNILDAWGAAFELHRVNFVV